VPSFIDDLEIIEAILGDVAAFASGQPISVTKTIGSETYSLSVVALPSGPAAPYQVITGTFWSILLTALADASAIAAGAPLAIAEKVGNTWYGTTVAVVPKVSASAAVSKL
jgi:hypothetical protein